MKRAISNLRMNLLGPRRKTTDSADEETRSDDDDHLSGQTTPHPSGLDKRLPQILHGFQQVCGALITPILTRGTSCAPSLPEHSPGPTEVEVGDTESPSYFPASTLSSATTSRSASSRTTATTTPTTTTAAAHTRHVSPSCLFLAPATEKDGALRLTAAAFLEGKDTPPATPRGTTSAGSALNGVVATAPTSNAAPSPRPVPGNITPVSRSGSGTTTTTISTITRDATHTTSPTVGPPKGKMVVRILEARGLRLSKEPYVVCTFESNEFISKGPKKEDPSTTEPPEKAGIAIPMKSRQSSSTSLSELQSGGAKKSGTTSPKWEHEAVL